MKRLLSTLTLFVACGVVNPVAAAETIFDFANLKGGSGDFVPEAAPNVSTCTGGDICSSDVSVGLGGTLTYRSDDIFVDVTGFYSGNSENIASVVQDHETGYNGQLYGSTATGAGLGVYHSVNPPTNDDNVTAGETLQLSFDQVVTLGTLGLRSEGHNTTGWISNAQFQYSINGSNWTTALLPSGSGAFALNLTSQDFWFRYGPGDGTPDQFYVSSVSVTPVPEPEIYAMLATGLGLLGWARRRKEARNS